MQTQILQYHVLSGKVEAAAAVDLAKANTEADTLLGEKISLSMSGDDLMIDGSSKVTATDVMASNGVVHLVCSPDTTSDLVQLPVPVSVHAILWQLPLGQVDLIITSAGRQCAGPSFTSRCCCRVHC